MKNILILTLAATASAFALTGCQQADDKSTKSNSDPARVGTTANRPAQTPARDPALPDPATAVAVQDAAEKARAMPGTPVAQPKAVAQEKMTKQEESNSMPMAGQVNDYSTTALDQKKKSP